MRIKFHIIGFCLFACLQKVGKRDIICSFHNAALFYVLNIKRLCVCVILSFFSVLNLI